MTEQEVEDSCLTMLVLAFGSDFAEGMVDLGSAWVDEGVGVLSWEVELLEEGRPDHLRIENRLRLIQPLRRDRFDSRVLGACYQNADQLIVLKVLPFVHELC